MTGFLNIVHSGLDGPNGYPIRRGIILSNYISLLLSAAILLIFVARNMFYGSVPNGPDMVSLALGLMIFLAPIFFNRAFWTMLSRIWLSIAPVAFLWFIYLKNMREMEFLQTSAYDSLRIHLLAMSIIPYLIFEKQKFRTLIFCCIPAFVSFTFLDVFMQAVGMRNPQLDIPGNDYQLMQIRGPIAYAIINGGCFIFQAVIAQGDEFNQRILGEVNLQASQIKEQYEKLVQSQQELNEMNLNLERLVEERTRDIRIQNHKLRGYAFSNAHHVRGPVARVLGLIQLSKMQLDIDRSWVFEKVESETLEIDRITRRITAELDASEIPDV